MQAQDKRACKACGASNGLDAAFCWQCLARFDAVSAVPGMPGAPAGAAPQSQGGFARPGMPQAPLNVPTSIPGTSSSGGGITFGRVAIGVVCALVFGFIGHRVLGGPDYHLPDTINGVARATDPSAKALEKQVSDEGKKYDLTIDTGIYGSSNAPDFLVIIVNRPSVESADSLFTSMTDGLASAGATIDGAPVTGMHDGSEYRCVLVHGSSASATACMWRDHDNVGIIMDPGSSLKDTQQLMWTAQSAIVG